MNKDQARNQGEVMIAWSQGKICQSSYKNQNDWVDLHYSDCDFSFFYDYRIKPEPMEIEVWIHRDGAAKILEPFNAHDPQKLGYTRKTFREVL